MRQRDIYLADLNPVTGSEQSGVRPVVIISGNALNDNLSICIICPLTSTSKSYAGCVRIPKTSENGLQYDSEAITFQLRVISKDRLTNRLGSVTKAELSEIHLKLMEIMRY